MPDSKSEEFKKALNAPAPERSALNPGSSAPEELKRSEEESSQAPVSEESIEVVDDVDDVADGHVGDQVEQENQGVDYTAELERLRKERDNYRQGMMDAKEKSKRIAEKVSAGEPVDPATDAYTIDDMSFLEERIAERISQRFSEQQQRWESQREAEYIDDSLKQLATDPGEMDLIRYHYDNSIKHSGYTKKSILQDLQSAKLLANRSRLLSENEEMKAALKSRNTAQDKPQFSGAKTASSTGRGKVRLTKSEKAFLDRYGATKSYVSQAKK